MPKVRIIYDVEGWAYHNRALALQKYAPADLAVTIAALGSPADPERALGDAPVDLVLFLPESPTRAIADALRRRGWGARLVCSWNLGWPSNLELFHATYAIVDAVIVNNRLAWEGIGCLPRTRLLANGVDRDVFRVTTPLAQRPPKVLWAGSQRGRDIKGYDRFILPLADRLQREGIACETRLVDSHAPGKASPAAMAEWYNGGTVLVCASAAEGTPNTALEAAACGCTVVSTAVGNMPELIRDGRNGYLVEPAAEALHAAVAAACTHYLRLAAAMQTDIAAWHWRARSRGFYDLFRALLADGAAAPAVAP